MNVLQRVILVAGAVVFVVVLLTAPRYVVVDNDKMDYEFAKEQKDKTNGDNYIWALAKMAPWHINGSMAITRGVAVLGATLLLYFAAGSQKPKLKKPDSNQLSFFK